MMEVCEFLDSENFKNLESLIVHLNVKECIVPTGELGPEGSKLKQVGSSHIVFLRSILNFVYFRFYLEIKY